MARPTQERARASPATIAVFTWGVTISSVPQVARGESSEYPLADLDYSCSERMPWSTPAVLSSNYICSGHGTCESNGTCTCHSGWTGLSDFVNTEYLDCQINTTVVQVLWALLMLLSVWCQYSIYEQLVDRWEKYKRLRSLRLKTGSKMSLWDQPGLLSVMIFSYVGFPGILIMGMLKFFMHDARIGVSVFITIIFAIVRISFYMMLYFYQPALLSTFLKGSRHPNSHVRFMLRITRLFGRVNLFMAAATSVLPFVIYADGSEPNNLAVSIFLAYMCSLLVTVVLHIIQAFIVRQKAKYAFSASVELKENSLMQYTKRKMVHGETRGIVHGIFQAIIYVTFAAVPFFYNKHDYFNPIGWCAYVLIAREMSQSAVVSHSRKELKSTALSSIMTQDLLGFEEGSISRTSSARHISPRYEQGISFRPTQNTVTVQTVSQVLTGNPFATNDLTFSKPYGEVIKKKSKSKDSQAQGSSQKGSSSKKSSLNTATSLQEVQLDAIDEAL
mmetsp:Transcript_7172/g.11893  ORF Transcript_7172/g.11893 Transcript_7172/m.11893 type:complete len:502 (-) Transcript_7172:100-1605(-)